MKSEKEILEYNEKLLEERKILHLKYTKEKHNDYIFLQGQLYALRQVLIK